MNHSTPQVAPAVLTFAQLFSSTRRGARLARLLTVEQLHSWPVSHCVTERAEQIVAELSANAALHGRVDSRLFRLTLALDTTAGLLRIAVTDARGECLPLPPADDVTSLDAESGRGLLLVTVLADRWGVEPYPPGGKTVWAECDWEGPGSGNAHQTPGAPRPDWNRLDDAPRGQGA
ncbi:ATP-binding protein [Streptomyces tendae]|uniref:ATP-binding protein n=1 Tax=Streptomyces tendae TaxID=1932 RepID=UPI0013309A54|nr:ATP-binding protein [Streptomyces tendae]